MKTNFKKILSLIFVFVMLLTAIPFSASATDYSNGDIITFGSYPQTKVTDEGIATELSSLVDENNWNVYDFYEGDGNKSNPTALKAKIAFYQDIIYGGCKYRAITLNAYRPYFTTSSTGSTLNKSNGYELNTLYFFKFEPIQWKILDKDSGLVLSLCGLDSQPTYINTNENLNAKFSSDYGESYVRTWLINQFSATAFTEDELKSIAETEIETMGYEYDKTNPILNTSYVATKTSDKIFLLSLEDARNEDYGFNTALSGIIDVTEGSFSDRICKASDYSLAMGVAANTGYCKWKLRTSCAEDGSWIVGTVGNLSGEKGQHTYCGIRPAMYVDLEKVNQKHIYCVVDGNITTIDSSDELPVPKKEGYTFESWNYDASSFNGNENIWIEAEWKINTHSITYSANNGIFEESKTEIKINDYPYSKELECPVLPSRQGYIFSGWSDGTKVYSNDEITKIKMPDNDLAFTAQWEPCTDTPYTVEMYIENLDGTYDLATAFQNTGITGESTMPVAPASIGFYIDTTNPDNKTTDIISADGSTVLKVYYKRNEYTITFNYNDGVTENLVMNNVKYGTENIQPSIPERKGYTTDGWNFSTVLMTKEYKLNWSKIDYTISFETNGGTVIADKTYNYGDSIENVSNPTKKGYNFVGWSPVIPETMPAEDLTITAIWEKIIYPTVSFKAPSKTKIKYHDVLVLSVNGTNLPEGTTYSFVSSSKCISVTGNGNTCYCRADANGSAEITATLMLNGQPQKDENGNNITSVIKLTTDCGFFAKFVSFFKDLFKSDRNFT